jgi:hypothetical protein
MSVLKIHMPTMEPRVETGAVKFGDDWPGYFIRGDSAAHLAMNISTIEEWFNAQPEEIRKNAFHVWLAVQTLANHRNAILSEVIAK